MFSFSMNHIALAVKDVSVSIGFYQNVLQLKEIPNTASNSKTRWVATDDGRQLHLIPRPKAEIKTDKAVHFALATANFNAFLAVLENYNIEHSDWPNSANKNYVRKDGVRQVYFQDPDGYWIEINDAI